MAKKKKKTSLPEHYTSIDEMPIINWDKYHTDKNPVHLLVKPKKLTKAQKIELGNVWRAIYSEYIKVFGFDEKFQRVLQKRMEIAKLTLKKILTKDASVQNFINKKKKELELLMNYNKGSGGDIYKSKIAIEQRMGIRIPLKECSVREYYTYLREIKHASRK